MVTIYNRHFHEFPVIDKDARSTARCVGCSFAHEDADFCGELLRNIDHEGCGAGNCVFVLDDEQHIANYMALRMGAEDGIDD
jgi:hypothetical protein